MELKGERLLGVDRATAWRALNDPGVLRACIPGCESVEKAGDNEFTVVQSAALGPVKARFQGRIRLEDIVEPASYTIRFEGQGGAAGFAKGAARVSLDEESPNTRLGYAVEAQVGGRLAQVGSRLIDSAALKLADDFFAAFEREVGGAAPAAAATDAVTSRTTVPQWVYFAIAAAIVAIALYLLR